MIIIEGPDASGKTTLAKLLGSKYYHFDYNSKYEDYLRPLASLDLFDAVLDRHIISEYAYSAVMNRKFAFTMKEWHNIILLTFIQNPLIILCTHKPLQHEYSKRQYLPYERWNECLRLYREFLDTHLIPYVEYDYAGYTQLDLFLRLEEKYRNKMSWWKPMWEAGYGCIGSAQPRILLVAERMGPNNMNNLPFETGPTGFMLTDLFAQTGTPLGTVAVTNMVKSFRRDTRPPNQADLGLLYMELQRLNPKKVVFMGSAAKVGIKVAKELGIQHEEVVHLGYYHHQGVTDMSGYNVRWKKIMGMIPTLE